MIKRRLAWIILIIGLMFSNIGFAIIIGESFKSSLAQLNDLKEEYREDDVEIVLIDEEIPGGELVVRDNPRLFAYKLYFIGLIIILIDLGVWRIK